MMLQRLLGSSKHALDLIVIGGGSGGLAAAKEAAICGAKVVLFDYVEPTSHGTKWGLGGTCVNVGCIPKKLMHRSARIGHTLRHDASKYGWNNQQPHTFKWEELVSTVQAYVKSLNFSYKVGLRSAQVEYINAAARMIDPHTVEYTLKGKTQQLQSNNVLIAVGGRPLVPLESEVPGARQYAITSDDLFSLKTSPGKTLVVGASYIALECAGFLTEFGFDTTVAVRSILLRGFDRQCAEKIGCLMKELGTKFYETTVPSRIEKLSSGKLLVSFPNRPKEEFDTVLYATGRTASTQHLGLESMDMKLTAASGKIIVDDHDCSSVPGVYAIGDNAAGRPELTPVAIKAGELLARRIVKRASTLMDYTNVPTTVFTPVEYGCCGLSEEDAITKYGVDHVEVYLFEFSPIEVSAAHWEKVASCRGDEFDTDMSPINLSKLVCLKQEDAEKVIGFHCVGLHAGEITQGYAVALKAGLTKKDFDAVVGIHPIDAESFTTMTVTRRSGENWVATGGCGGGKCG